MSAEAPTPPSVRWIRGARAALESAPGRAWAAALAVVVLLLLAGGLYTVDNGESAALLRFGALVEDAVAPGLHFRLPLGVDEVRIERTGELLRFELEGDFRPELSLVTGDENLIAATVAVQYRVTDLGSALFAADDGADLLRQSLRAALVEAFAGHRVDDVLTSAKAQIQLQVRERVQGHLERYGLGLTLASVNLQTVEPPREADQAFRDVVDARAEAAQTKSHARAEADTALRMARGAAAQRISEAEAAAHRRRENARGGAERFRQLLAQARTSPGLTRTDLHRETLSRVLRQARLILLQPGEGPTIDLEILPHSESGSRITPPWRTETTP